MHSVPDINIAGVLTAPDRQRGRGRKVLPSEVKNCADSVGLNVLQYEALSHQAIEEVRLLAPELMVVVAYGFILPTALLQVPSLGCINIHFSLLPRWRGATPVARAIEAGDTETGVTLMVIDEGLDTGPILAQTRIPIGSRDTTVSLEAKLAEIGSKLLTQSIVDLKSKPFKPVLQDESEATYAKKMQVHEAELEWKQPATSIDCKIRALNPWPVARTWLGDMRLRIWESEYLEGDSSSQAPGTVVRSDKNGLVVAAHEGWVKILSLQKENRRQLKISEFLSGTPIPVGSRFSRTSKK